MQTDPTIIQFGTTGKLLMQNNINKVGELTQTYPITQALDFELANLEDAKALLEARIEVLREEITNRLAKGERFALYQLKQQRGLLRWKFDLADIAALARREGFDLKKPLELITPLQAQKLGLAEELIDALASRGAGATKLTRVQAGEVADLLNPNHSTGELKNV